MPSDHNRFKLKLKKKVMAGKPKTDQRLNHIILNNTWIKEEVSKNYFKQNETENIPYQIYRVQ